MKRISFEEYNKAIELINAYKQQCNNDLNLIDNDLSFESKSLNNVQVGQMIKVIKDVKPSKFFKKGDTYRVFDKSERRGLQIRHKQGNVYWIPFANTYGRWGF